MAYKKKQRQGWFMKHDDMNNLIALVPNRDLRYLLESLNSLSYALSRGEEEPSPPTFKDKGSMAAYRVIADSIRFDDEQYKDKCKSNSINRGKGIRNDDGQRSSTNVFSCLSGDQYNTTQYNSNSISMTNPITIPMDADGMSVLEDTWIQCYGRPSGQDLQQLELLSMDYEVNDIAEAIRIAGGNKSVSKPFPYIKGILKKGIGSNYEQPGNGLKFL